MACRAPPRLRRAALGLTRPRLSLRARRLVLIALVAAALGPGLWWRSLPRWPRDNHAPTLTVSPLQIRTPAFWPAGLRVAGAWRLTSTNNRFGGYSALLATDGETLSAISDIGKTLQFRRPDLGGRPEPRFGRIGLHDGRYFYPDIEAATLDPQTGTRWYGYEKSNKIGRFMASDSIGWEVKPAAMRDWPENGGPEAMVRLADGRFIVLAEDPSWLSSGERPALLFAADPASGVQPQDFRFRPPIGYHPSDMAALPDGRVVVLVRAVDPLPPFFRCMLLVADPADIAAGREWPWRELAELSEPVPRENYEGLAIVPDAGGVTMWVISDDNMAFFQRTLLLKLHWRVPPRAAAAN